MRQPVASRCRRGRRWRSSPAPRPRWSRRAAALSSNAHRRSTAIAEPRRRRWRRRRWLAVSADQARRCPRRGRASEKVRTPATRVPGFLVLAASSRARSRSAAPTARSGADRQRFARPKAPAAISAQPRRMPGDMIGHEGRDEIIAVVVARLAAQRQRDAGVAAGGLQQLRPKLLFQERVGLADVDQQFRRPARRPRSAPPHHGGARPSRSGPR